MTHTPPHWTTLITADALHRLMQTGAPLVVFDCSFDLMQPQAGTEQYTQAHIPGALYAHLDTDLSAKPPITERASGGRHPLPTRDNFARWLGARGVSHSTQVVVYDRQGMNYCGRLWWMLRWLGHEAVAVLDGGLQAWQALGYATASGAPVAPTVDIASDFTLRPPLVELVDAQTVQAQLGDPRRTVLDARAAARYRGEVEPLDPKAGHIPGALNRPFASNLTSDGFFKSPEQLRAEFSALLGERDPAQLVHHCGSGVSAVPNVLAMEVAGLGRTALYAGSWSDWCSDASRPVAQG